MRVYYDLHLHSCLSPCGDEDMTPWNTVNMAKLLGLDMIAITDHNSCANCRSAMKVGEKIGITIVAGMELCTAEEVHCICLFDDIDKAEKFSDFVKSRYGKNIILVKLSLKDKYVTLDNRIEKLSDDSAFAEKKEFLERYEGMFAALTDCYVVDVAKHFYADDSFALGGAHIVHYEKEFYSCCAKHITEILSGCEEKYHSEADKNYILLRDLRLKR